MFDKYSNIKFHKNLSSEGRFVPCRRTDRQTNMAKLTVAFRSFANAPNKVSTRLRSQAILRYLTCNQKTANKGHTCYVKCIIDVRFAICVHAILNITDTRVSVNCDTSGLWLRFGSANRRDRPSHIFV
jgi:hypothetical protein